MFDESTGDRDPLPLSAGEARAGFGNRGIIAVRLLPDEFVSLCDRSRRFDFRIGRFGIADFDIFADC